MYTTHREHVEALERELREARATITELQARGTELVLERRSVDRRAQVREFFATMGQDMPERPAVPDEASVRLGLRLIAEEFFELLAGALDRRNGRMMLDKTPEDFDEAEHFVMSIIRDLPVKVDMPELVDACVDLSYVVEGMAVRLGVDLRPAWTEVHRSNLAKVGALKDAHGKIGKPLDWTPPDIESVLRAQGWQG